MTESMSFSWPHKVKVLLNSETKKSNINQANLSIFLQIQNIESSQDENKKISFILSELRIIMQTIRGKRVELLHDTHPENLTDLLLSLRGLGR